MRTLGLILACCLGALSGRAGQQGLFWNISTSASVDRYEFRFGTNAGSYQQSVWLTNRLTSSNTFTLPAGRWYAVGLAVSTNNGLSDPSNEVVFDIPTPIIIRLNLSSADTPEGPWTVETNAPVLVTLTAPRRFYRATLALQR